MSKNIYITDYECVTPLGFDLKSNWENLVEGNSGISKHSILQNQEVVYASKIQDELLKQKFFENFSTVNFTRLEKMIALALQPVIERNGISEKTLLILSTTKGNISALKNQQQPPADSYLQTLAQKIADFFKFSLTPVVISNACVSGIMAVSAAKKLIQANYCTDAYIIAADEISEFVVSGFNSFQAMSSEPCRPYDAKRTGINLGEAAAVAYVTTAQQSSKVFQILGDSSVNDANHISGPSRTGEGLYRSVMNAIKEANLRPSQIQHISAHGTATVYNDEMESLAFSRSALSEIPMNSLKGYYGHCLGAAGLLETIISMEASKENILLKTKNFHDKGVSGKVHILQEHQKAEFSIFLKTASGFGGCNTAVIFQKIS